MHTYNIQVRNREGYVVAVSEGQFILEGLEAAGLTLPFGCRYGACLTCAASLIDGAVDQSGGRAFALRPHQVEDGYVLLCVARPRADCVVDVGTRKDLYVNPFKRGPRAAPAT